MSGWPLRTPTPPSPRHAVQAGIRLPMREIFLWDGLGDTVALEHCFGLAVRRSPPAEEPTFYLVLWGPLLVMRINRQRQTEWDLRIRQQRELPNLPRCHFDFLC